MVYDLGRGVAFAAPLAPGRAARRAAAAGLRCVSPSSTPPSATWAAAALLILMTLTLHRMVWRDADADGDARSSRRGLPIEQGAALPPHRACRCTGCHGALVALAAVRLGSAEPLRRAPGPRAHRAVRPRGRLAVDRPWGLPLGVGARLMG